MIKLYIDCRRNLKIECGCHCINCGSTELESHQVGDIEDDGYFDMHHTCIKCKIHFDHLEGETFEKCEKCQDNTS